MWDKQKMQKLLQQKKNLRVLKEFFLESQKLHLQLIHLFRQPLSKKQHVY